MMDAKLGSEVNKVRPLQWGEWKRLRVDLLQSMQGIITDAINQFADLTTNEARVQFALGALTKLDGFEELAVSRAIEPVTDDTPVGIAQVVRYQGGMQIVEAAAADADFIAGAAEVLAPLMVKAATQAMASNSGRSAGGRA